MKQNRALGTGAALGAFFLWGILPLYWYAIRHVPAFVITLHRVGWAAVLAWIIVLVRRRLGLSDSYGSPAEVPLWPGWRVYGRLLPNGLVLVGNWGIYIWAVNNGHTLDASLGYYINPLVNVLLGMLFFQERLAPMLWIAVALATGGVVLQTVGLGYLPWISLVLAFSFGIYGAVKKHTRMSSIHSLAVELASLGPAALLLIGVGVVLEWHSGTAMNPAWAGSDFLAGDPLSTWVLLGAGVATVAPLMLFGIAAQNIRLSDVGFFQYIGPTLMLIIGSTIFHEPLDQRRMPGFILVWIALLVYSLSNVLNRRRTV